jgi:hypothetical protein
MIGSRRYIVRNSDFETVWKHVSYNIHGAVERSKIRHLLYKYLAETPCTDRYLTLVINGKRWIFEIVTNRRGPNYTEVVLSENPLRR